MAIKVQESASGNAAQTGAMKTPPAKLKPTFPALKEKDTGGAYGQNHWTGGSSTPMDQVPLSPAAANLKASVDDDGILDRIIGRDKPSKGAIADIDLMSPQTRDVSSQSYPISSGMVRQQADYSTIGKSGLPNKQSGADDDGGTRRNAALKRTS